MAAARHQFHTSSSILSVCSSSGEDRAAYTAVQQTRTTVKTKIEYVLDSQQRGIGYLAINYIAGETTEYKILKVFTGCKNP